ncbi:MAG: shikimate kinase [Myxococcota bacterium]
MGDREEHPALSRNLVLIGGRGCGKSSLAKRLARCNRNFMLFTLDALIRYEAEGLTIPEIVARDGWPGFRALERTVVDKVSVFEGGALIDAGGGVVVELDEEGRERFSETKVTALRRHGLVVYLYRDPAFLLARVGRDDNRPALSAEPFAEIHARRDPWYRRAADHVLECTELSKIEMQERVLAWYYGELGIDAPAASD